ncbi:MAG: hypothetical protein OXP08_12585 [bacterium]|nr:hypothetical protein [bacterium]
MTAAAGSGTPGAAGAWSGIASGKTHLRDSEEKPDIYLEVGAGDGRLSGCSYVLGLDLHAEERRLRCRDSQTGRWLPDPGDLEHTDDASRQSETRSSPEPRPRRPR